MGDSKIQVQIIRYCPIPLPYSNQRDPRPSKINLNPSEGAGKDRDPRSPERSWRHLSSG